MTLQQLESGVNIWASFVKAHEKLVLILALVGLGFYGYNRGVNAWEAYDKRHVALDQQKIDQAHQENAALAQQLAALKFTVDTNARIADAKISAAHEAAKKQQATDQQLPLPDLAQRWASLLPITTHPDDIVPAPDNKLVLTEFVSRATVVELERIPDLTESVVQTTAELAGCNQVRAKQDEVLAGKDKELIAEKQARVDDAKLAKVAQRKSWLRGFKVGAIVGFVAGAFLGHSV